MRIIYKTLTVAVLFGLVCYTGRSLNMSALPPPTAEQSLEQVKHTASTLHKIQQGENIMSEHTAFPVWDKTKETIHAARDAVAEDSQKLWDSTKENSQKAAHKVSEESEKLWDKTKEKSTETWEKTKEGTHKLMHSNEDAKSTVQH